MLRKRPNQKNKLGTLAQTSVLAERNQFKETSKTALI